MLTFTVEVPPDLVAKLRKLQDGIEDPELLSQAIGQTSAGLTREHLVHLAQTRHATATRLGGEPTNHWGGAAEKVFTSVEGRSATVTIPHPGIGRAAHDVTIKPGAGKEFLTIPVIGLAYGHRAREFPGLFAVKNAAAGVLIKKEPGKTVGTVYFALVKQVNQKQDRSLLPSSEAYMRGAIDAVGYVVDFLMKKEAA